MIKKIKVKDLKVGMFVHDFNCNWVKHPFFVNQMKIKDDKVKDKLLQYGIKEILIDIDQGCDVGGSTVEEIKLDPVKEVVKPDKEQKSDEAGESEVIQKKTVQQVPLEREINRARKIQNETVKAVGQVINDIKMGKHVETKTLEPVVDDMVNSILRNQDALLSMGLLRKTDEYLYYHSMSVCVLMMTFARHMGFDPEEIKEVGIGAMLHDIGTTKVPPVILKKTGRLTDAEYDIIKTHVIHTKDILSSAEGVSELAVRAASEHHERIDGSGYPEGLKEDDISVYGQIIAIVDVYDALTTGRTYRGRIPPTESLKILYDNSGTKFSRELVQKFIRCVGIYPVGTVVRLKSGLLGIVVSHHEDNLLAPKVRVVYNTDTDTPVAIPYDIDLAETPDNSKDVIVCYETAEKWQLWPEVYI
jgi:HD-GYP domain-containing protein (c-di-GMP phosphodiesterase class II)